MKLLHIALCLFMLTLAGCMNENQPQPTHYYYPHPAYRATASDLIHIRFIAMKHSHIAMADGDARLAINAAKRAASNGLSIKVIGDHNIDKDGKKVALMEVQFWEIDKFRQYVSEQMRVDAKPGDTFMMFTIGHGFSSGGLDNMGQREAVMKAIAQAASENQQRTVWWQLACHATARLPNISSLPPDQRKWLTIVASSDASQVSPAGVEGNIMKQVFDAMAERSEAIDPNQDDMITGHEFKNFLSQTRPSRGSRCFMEDYNDVVFGFYNIANQIPIRDWTRPQQGYPDDYVPYPGR